MFRTFFWKLYHFWDCVEIYGRAWHTTDDNIIRCMRVACRSTKATNTHRICNISFFCLATVATLTCLCVNAYMYIVWLVTDVFVFICECVCHRYMSVMCRRVIFMWVKFWQLGYVRMYKIYIIQSYTTLYFIILY